MPDPISIAGTGVVLGVVHVLTGPDHLSAIATLAANEANAFWLGIRWGVGHSTGLLFVGLVLLIVLDANGADNDTGGDATVDVPIPISHLFEGFVGIFMIFLGIYGIVRALRKERSAVEETATAEDVPFVEEGMQLTPIAEVDNELNSDDSSPIPKDHSSSDSSNASGETHNNNDNNSNKTGNNDNENFQDEPPSSSRYLPHGHLHFPAWCYCQIWDNITTRIPARLVAVLVGIVHGFAGPGGVLGVIPAVQIRNAALGGLYLGCFCVTSTITMGAFALAYGRASQKVGDLSPIWALRTELMSASLSVIVGIIWLLALATGSFDALLG